MIHMFDDPKQLYGSATTFPVSREHTTVFEVDMGCETYRSNAEDCFRLDRMSEDLQIQPGQLTRHRFETG